MVRLLRFCWHYSLYGFWLAFLMVASITLQKFWSLPSLSISLIFLFSSLSFSITSCFVLCSKFSDLWIILQNSNETLSRKFWKLISFYYLFRSTEYNGPVLWAKLIVSISKHFDDTIKMLFCLQKIFWMCEIYNYVTFLRFFALILVPV